jgi:2'-5' RNA ligase
MRVFIAADVPPEIKEEIIFLQNRIVSPSWTGKLIEPENLHLTIKFLGEISEKKMIKVKSLLDKIRMPVQPIKMEYNGIFNKNGMPTIIWVKIAGLEKIHKRINEVLKFNFDKEEKFIAHITIGKIKKIINKTEFTKKMQKLKIKPIQSEIKEFKLYLSDLSQNIPQYLPLKTYTLRQQVDTGN